MLALAPNHRMLAKLFAATDYVVAQLRSYHPILEARREDLVQGEAKNGADTSPP